MDLQCIVRKMVDQRRAILLQCTLCLLPSQYTSSEKLVIGGTIQRFLHIRQTASVL